MPSGDPWYIRALDQLGVNTTKLRWRLYQREKQANPRDWRETAGAVVVELPEQNLPALPRD